MSNPVEALIQDWRERGRRLEPTRHKAIRRGDGGAADIYDAEQRALFACADELASALASLRSSPEVETLITRFDELAEHDAGCLRFHSSTDGACDCRIAALRADLLASLRAAAEKPTVDNGNIDVFCDHVEQIGTGQYRGCVRGVGHGGEHLLQAGQVPPLCPVTLAGRGAAEPEQPTPDQKLEGPDPRVPDIVRDIAGAFRTTRGSRPAFERRIDVEEVVRFVLLRAARVPAEPEQPSQDARRRCPAQWSIDVVCTRLDGHEGDHEGEPVNYGGEAARVPAPPQPEIDPTQALDPHVDRLVALIQHSLAHGGCSNCGGLPHTTTCRVGRLARAFGHPEGGSPS